MRSASQICAKRAGPAAPHDERREAGALAESARELTAPWLVHVGHEDHEVGARDRGAQLLRPSALHVALVELHHVDGARGDGDEALLVPVETTDERDVHATAPSGRARGKYPTVPDVMTEILACPADDHK